MAVESPMAPLGLALANRSLPDSGGINHPLREVDSKATLIAFVCNHCPYVRDIETALGDPVEYPNDGIKGMET